MKKNNAQNSGYKGQLSNHKIASHLFTDSFFDVKFNETQPVIPAKAGKQISKKLYYH